MMKVKLIIQFLERVHSHSLGHELLGTKGVCYVFDGVAKAVGVVVGWVDTPLVPRTQVGCGLDPVHHGVLLAVLQTVLHPQRGFSYLVVAISHVLGHFKKHHYALLGTAVFLSTNLKEFEGLLWGPFSPGAVLLRNLLMAYVGVPPGDEGSGVLIELGEVVRGVWLLQFHYLHA